SILAHNFTQDTEMGFVHRVERLEHPPTLALLDLDYHLDQHIRTVRAGSKCRTPRSLVFSSLSFRCRRLSRRSRRLLRTLPHRNSAFAIATAPLVLADPRLHTPTTRVRRSFQRHRAAASGTKRCLIRPVG